MQQPLSQFSHEKIKKNSTVALYVGEDEDHHGLPFFLINVFDKNEKDIDGAHDEDNDESDEAPEHMVKIHEYIQTKSNASQPTGKYHADEEREKQFESHNSQGGHFESPNRPNCFVDREDEQR